MITASEVPPKGSSATMLNFTWNIPTRLLVVTEQLLGSIFAAWYVRLSLGHMLCIVC